jgi:DNA-binding transcriptional LysR family regulator
MRTCTSFVQSNLGIWYIHGMHDGLGGLDLNLLTALHALLTEAHVGKAARRLGLSQPATSHALRRLRDLLGDPLLVREGTRLELTPRAESLRNTVCLAVDQVREVFRPEVFDPLTSSRSFAIILPDHLMDLVVPALLERIETSAPNVRIDIKPWRGSAVALMPELSGSIDIAIACTPVDCPGFNRLRLFEDTEALACRTGHPGLARLRTTAGFSSAAHVAVIPSGKHEDPVDTWLREHSVERKIRLSVPSYLQALHVASLTDLVAFIPRRLIEAVAGTLQLEILEPPIDPGFYEEFLFYPSRSIADAGSIWLRSQLSAIAKRLDRPIKGRQRSSNKGARVA